MSSNFVNTSGYGWITGAGSGIGRATAHEYAKSGVSGLYLIDRNAEGLNKVVAEVKEMAVNPKFKVLSKSIDITDEPAIQSTIDEAVKEFGRIDYGCCIAGILDYYAPTLIEEIDLAAYDNVMNVNVKGTFLCLRRVFAQMKKQEVKSEVPGRKGVRGAIVVLASIAGERPWPTHIPYTTSKFATVGLIRTAAAEFGSDLVRVNGVCPFFTDGPMVDSLVAYNEGHGGPSKLEGAPMLKRLGELEEIGDMCVFLCSSRACFVTGQLVSVDGGFHGS